MKILILEDDRRRAKRMMRLLGDAFPQITCHLFPTARQVNDFFEQHAAEIVFIALDHDLEDVVDEEGNRTDAGTGRHASDFLAQQRPCCPILIHSTNRPAAEGMEFDLTEAGWTVQRIAPYEDLLWIEEQWLPALHAALREVP